MQRNVRGLCMYVYSLELPRITTDCLEEKTQREELSVGRKSRRTSYIH